VLRGAGSTGRRRDHRSPARWSARSRSPISASLWFARPYGRALVALFVLCAAVVFWWMRIPPSNDRDWMPDVAELPRAQLDGNILTVENVRDFVYRSDNDYDVRWVTRIYDLSKLEHLDMFFSFWGPTDIAHTIMSWSFAEGPALAISIETRKEKGESYSALLGFFRQYELYYVVARERDVIGVRDRFAASTYVFAVGSAPARARAPALLREGDQPDRRPAGVVQRVHRKLHDLDPQPRALRRRGGAARLAALRERASARAAVRARRARQEPALPGARREERDHRAREVRRHGRGLLAADPHGPAADGRRTRAKGPRLAIEKADRLGLWMVGSRRHPVPLGNGRSCSPCSAGVRCFALSRRSRRAAIGWTVPRDYAATRAPALTTCCSCSLTPRSPGGFAPSSSTS
jgi:hypothetical protein